MIRFSSLKSRLYRLQDDRPWSRYIYLIPCFLSFFLLDFTFRYIYADFGSTGLWNKIPLLFSFGFADKTSVIGWIASFGGGAELLEPVELRSELARFGEKIREKHLNT